MNQIDQSIIEAKLPREDEHLDALERMRALDAYYEWSVGLLKEWIGNRVLDAGCGIGNGTAVIAEKASLVVAADLSPQNVQMLKQRFAECPSVIPKQVDLEANFTHLRNHEFDTVLCMDVLEHLEDDLELLKQFREITIPGGHLLIKVPALQFLYGSIDEVSDHYRRYSRKRLSETARQAGWTPITCRYMNFAGVLPYFIKSRILRRNANLSRTFSEKQLRTIRRVIPYLQKLDKLIGPPLGQSVVLVARNK